MPQPSSVAAAPSSGRSLLSSGLRQCRTPSGRARKRWSGPVEVEPSLHGARARARAGIENAQGSGSGATSPLIISDALHPSGHDQRRRRLIAGLFGRHRPLHPTSGPLGSPGLACGPGAPLGCPAPTAGNGTFAATASPPPVPAAWPPPPPPPPPIPEPLRLVGCPPVRLEVAPPAPPVSGVAAVPPLVCSICLI